MAIILVGATGREIRKLSSDQRRNSDPSLLSNSEVDLMRRVVPLLEGVECRSVVNVLLFIAGAAITRDYPRGAKRDELVRAIVENFVRNVDRTDKPT